MTDDISPRATILGIVAQVQLSRALACTVELGIADRVDSAAATAAELGADLGLNAGALYRLLRMLASHGIFSEDDDGRFHSTPLSQVLVTGADDSVKDMLRQPWQDIVWQTYLKMPHTLRTGRPAFDKAHGAPFFDYLAANPDANRMFDASMALISGPEEACVAEAYPYGDFGRIVDVGGGRGGLLAAILERHPAVRGVLFDQPQVVAEPTLLSDDHLARCELVHGDFFQWVPEGGDLYLLKRILHDWDDAEAAQILRVCAKAGGGRTRILVVEAIIRPGNQPDPVKAQDVGMMLLTPGRERTEAEYSRLFWDAGLEIAAVHPVPAPAGVSIIEAVRK